jgi:thymidylate kinase
MGLYKHHPPLPPGVGLGGRAALQFGRYLRARYHRARGRVVLFDRYTHDALVQHQGASALKLRIHRSVLAHAAPPPDLMIVLDVPGETLHARKGERDPVTLEAMRVGYGNIAARVGGPIVDATADIEDVRRAVVALIWAAVAGRRAPRPPGI